MQLNLPSPPPRGFLPSAEFGSEKGSWHSTRDVENLYSLRRFQRMSVVLLRRSWVCPFAENFHKHWNTKSREMSVHVTAERGERLATDNPENIFIRSDFHTINHGINPSIKYPLEYTGRMKPDTKHKHTFANRHVFRLLGLNDGTMRPIYSM